MYIKISKIYKSLLKSHGNRNIATENNSKRCINSFIYIYNTIKTFSETHCKCP